jgi:hypothetical protein
VGSRWSGRWIGSRCSGRRCEGRISRWLSSRLETGNSCWGRGRRIRWSRCWDSRRANGATGRWADGIRSWATSCARNDSKKINRLIKIIWASNTIRAVGLTICCARIACEATRSGYNRQAEWTKPRNTLSKNSNLPLTEAKMAIMKKNNMKGIIVRVFRSCNITQQLTSRYFFAFFRG